VPKRKMKKKGRLSSSFSLAKHSIYHACNSLVTRSSSGWCTLHACVKEGFFSISLLLSQACSKCFLRWVGGRGVQRGRKVGSWFLLGKTSSLSSSLALVTRSSSGGCTWHDMTWLGLKKLFFSNSLLCKACLRCLWGREGRKGSERGVSQQLY